ncbi:tRNA N(3)-methylcytidine methyltransferase METTL2-like isoform X1 [Hydractinia symbiolongicarpus]|uniref:tRNA N(3)-methylcytidine methyltransferase METTL2-like isoform X1 n=1 Tax=Hydractinia symbiolongicarpus TaxID=13093 RepID=UPI00254A1833|nr:tRNA N(3)-methylcytidine methyltransferase METTL2-like isoform X1 [Hydractinia symbiolongicarpus]
MAEKTCASDSEEKRPQFGSRYLTDNSNVFEHNAWDDVEWDSELEEEAKEKIKINSVVSLNEDEIEKYEEDAGKFWDIFYCQHQNKFFKDRHWLFTEFQELAPQGWDGPIKVGTEDQNIVEKSFKKMTVTDDVSFPGCTAKIRIMEVGCGVGNTVFPILQTNNDPDLFVYCCDFADSAIKIVKNHALYDTSRCHAFVFDATDEQSNYPFPKQSLDMVVLIFVLSAIHPDKMLWTLKRLTEYLKPGGVILFRDYGRYDMAQLRFKPGRCLSENFYVRGDGTRVYFFTQDEIDEMFTKCGLMKKQNIIDRRLQVNRGRQLKMYRVWVQCKYQKPPIE